MPEQRSPDRGESRSCSCFENADRVQSGQQHGLREDHYVVTASGTLKTCRRYGRPSANCPHPALSVPNSQMRRPS